MDRRLARLPVQLLAMFHLSSKAPECGFQRVLDEFLGSPLVSLGGDFVQNVAESRRQAWLDNHEI
jgi:hypothetical protein